LRLAVVGPDFVDHGLPLGVMAWNGAIATDAPSGPAVILLRSAGLGQRRQSTL
jgi:hypothetical protein